MMRLTSEGYVATGGSLCPNCQSSDIEGTGRLSYDGDWQTNEIQCLDCGAYWDDLYTLDGYENLEIPRAEPNDV